jgi:hypothetical protein
MKLHKSGNNRMGPKNNIYAKNDIFQKMKGHTRQGISKVDIKQ